MNCFADVMSKQYLDEQSVVTGSLHVFKENRVPDSLPATIKSHQRIMEQRFFTSDSAFYVFVSWQR